MNNFDFDKRMKKLIEKRDRVNDMKRLRQSGWTLQAIADKYGVTKQWVFQVVGKVEDNND